MGVLSIKIEMVLLYARGFMLYIRRYRILQNSPKFHEFSRLGLLKYLSTFNKNRDENQSLLSETIQSLTSQGLPDLPSPSKQSKAPILKRVKDGLLHYWHGSKLLAYETKISSGLIFKLLKGEDLIRRERRQLLRTSSDLLRLVPFIVIAIIPFLEFALPVLLKLFPNMLPSTFEDKFATNEKIRKQIKIKLETAKFLQSALESMSASGSVSSKTKEFADLYKKARITGESLTLAELERVCHSLKDSLTIENLDRAQIVSLCKYMDVRAFGTTSFLRYQARKALEMIRKDDEEIEKEGVDSLFPHELEHSCRQRGLFFPGINENLMRRELNSWLNLHLKKGIPSVLLILSRALSPNMNLHKPEESLKDTILSLSEVVVNEAELHQQEISGSNSISFKQKIEVLEQQQDLIAEELAEKQIIKEDTISKHDLRVLSDAISILSSDNPVAKEKLELEELKTDISEFKHEVKELEEVSANALKEPKAAELIGEKIEKLIGDIEEKLISLQDKLGARLNLISADAKGQITLDQLESVFTLIRHNPIEQARLDKIIKTFDTDGDGKVFIADIIEMAKIADESEGCGVLVSNNSSSNSNDQTLPHAKN